MNQGQNYRNHRQFVPLYHFGVGIPFLFSFVWSVWQLRSGLTSEHVMTFVLAVGLMILYIAARGMVLRVQDRLIRLEMQLRLQKILPVDLRARIHDLTVDQLVGLRFAGDEEMPGLVREVLAGQLTSRNAIKLKVKNWQGDYLRA
jgi:hypothetical protein